MIRKFIAFALLVNISFFASAQPSSLLWKFAVSGTEANIVLMETDYLGNSYFAGTFDSSEFHYSNFRVNGITGDQTINTFLLKTDPTGKAVWLQSFQGDASGSQITPKAISINRRGEMAVVLAAEKTSSVVSEDANIPADPAYVVPILLKISKMGNIEWGYNLICYADTMPEIEAKDVFIDEEGDVYSTGYFRGSSAEISGQTISGKNTDAMLFVACLRAVESDSWLKNVGTDGGDNGDLIGTHIANTEENFFYVAGTYEGALGFYLGADTIKYSNGINSFIARFNKDGEAVWGKHIRGDSLDSPEKIEVLSDNSIVLLGMSNSPQVYIEGSPHPIFFPGFNLFLASFNPDGNHNNTLIIPTQKPMHYNDNRNAFMKTDRYGNIHVCSEFFGNTIFNADATLTNFDAGTSDVFVAKISSNTFTPLWTFHGAGIGNNYIEAFSVNSSGDVYLGGTTYSEYFVSDQPLPASEEGTPYIAKILSDGTFDLDYLYWQNNDKDDHIRVKALGSDSYGNTYVAGDFSGPTSALQDIDLVESSNKGIFIGKYSYTKSIRGSVKNQLGEPLSEGYVKIFGYTLYQRSPLNDSTQLKADGSFDFFDVPYGNYILSAVPVGSGAEIYMPSYFPAAEYWEFAEQIEINADVSQNFFSIIIQEKSVFNGESKVSGNLQEEDGVKNAPGRSPDKARPTKKAKVILAGSKKQFKSTYEIIAYTETDEEGNFSFTDVEDGDYYIWVDIPGLPCEPVYQITITGKQYVSNLNYMADEEVVKGVGFAIHDKVDGIFDEEGFSIFPNPAKDYLTISINDFTKGIIDLYDSKGSHLMHLVLKGETTTIGLAEYDSGNYYVRIMTENKISFKKLTVAH